MYATAQSDLIVSMFFGLISARPTEVVSIVKLARVLMNASRSSYSGTQHNTTINVKDTEGKYLSADTS